MQANEGVSEKAVHSAPNWYEARAVMEVVLVSFFHLLDNLELPKKKKPQLKKLLIRLACEHVYGTLS